MDRSTSVSTLWWSGQKLENVQLFTCPSFTPKTVNIVRAKFSKTHSRKRSGHTCGRNFHTAAPVCRAYLCGHFDIAMSTCAHLYRKLNLLKVEGVRPPWENPIIKGEAIPWAINTLADIIFRRHKGRPFFGSRQPARSFWEGKIACFWTGDFWKILVVCRSGAAFPCGFTFFLGARPPVHFGDLELTGTKNRLS